MKLVSGTRSMTEYVRVVSNREYKLERSLLKASGRDLKKGNGQWGIIRDRQDNNWQANKKRRRKRHGRMTSTIQFKAVNSGILGNRIAFLIFQLTNCSGT